MSTERDTLSQLDRHEANSLIDFFLYYMSQDQRRALMASRPQVYAKLFPSASAEVISGVVKQQLLLEAEQATGRIHSLKEVA
jgi:hypothetical protein